ncbi:MAG: caspase family protein [Burkholderiales bacterium]
MVANNVNESRRRMLKTGLGTTALFLPAPYAWVWAQSEGAMKLLRLPKLALVIGNSKYARVPTLINPGNDAKAISDVLSQSGFDVTSKLDATLEDMAATMRTYVQTLAAKKAVGLFYFAGHGVQLSWRNYLVPVDAAVRRPEDIQKTCVDLTSLIEGINKASNPMNVVILDACRENPFGAEARLDARGLSQMDAPHSTLLAYATAPGNVASDGEGANGLYTENLLREMRVPEAKIEDVFKRVRLHVRRRTNGQQIPWESTSLEEDFYFVPPKTLSSLADAETERERKLDEAAREKQRAVEEAERKRKQELALQEAKRMAEDAERKRQQELAELEKRRITEEAERKRKQEIALKEAQRVAEETERKRREEQALREARLAEEDAERKYKQELAQREKQREAQEAERKRKEEQALREAKLAEEDAERKYKQELALREKQRAQKPASGIKPDVAATERLFEEELVIWERIKTSNEPELLEDYLLRYPSGRFSELVQLRLDLVLTRQGEKKIEVVSDAKNPYSKGSAMGDTRYKIGDTYTYRRLDRYTKQVEETYTGTIIEITDTEVRYDSGLVTNLLGNYLRVRDGRRFTDSQATPLEFAVGKRWPSRVKLTFPNGMRGIIDLDFRIVTRERVTVPAGSFDAFRVEARGWSVGDYGSARVELNIWHAPGKVRRPVMSEVHRQNGPKIIESSREELMAFRES